MPTAKKNPVLTQAKRTGDNLVRIRGLRNLNQRALAAKAGIPERSICRWETGKSLPSGRILVRLAEALGVESFELLK
jgi:transcriptional regulator with XRE-family HTH domain